MHLPPPTVTYLVKQLEARGFLERRAEPGDLRKFRLVQTARREGGAHAEAGRPSGTSSTSGCGGSTPEEVVAFDRIVKRLAGAATAGADGRTGGGHSMSSRGQPGHDRRGRGRGNSVPEGSRS